jgi:MFS family permease
MSQPPAQRWRAFALLVVAYFITIVDFTIVNVALPTIGRKLHFPESDLQWVVTAYGLTFAGFLLLGRRPGGPRTHPPPSRGRRLRPAPEGGA